MVDINSWFIQLIYTVDCVNFTFLYLLFWHRNILSCLPQLITLYLYLSTATDWHSLSWLPAAATVRLISGFSNKSGNIKHLSKTYVCSSFNPGRNSKLLGLFRMVTLPMTVSKINKSVSALYSHIRQQSKIILSWLQKHFTSQAFFWSFLLKLKLYVWFNILDILKIWTIR